MDKFKSSKDALKMVIKGEREAVAYYKEYSKVAEKEDLPNISRLFKALVVAENVHIKNHLNALGEEVIKGDIEITSSSTLENLQSAINGEKEESKKLYPKLIKSIKSDTKESYGKVAQLSMEWAMKVEKGHAKLLKLALKSLKSGKDLDVKTIRVCRVCGNISTTDDDASCDVCGHDYQFFTEV